MHQLDKALRHFKKVDRRLRAAALPHRGSLPKELSALRTSAKLFSRLCRSVVGQQLGGAAARAIWKRVEAASADVTPERISGIAPRTLRACGLSGAKVKTLKAIARATLDGSLDFLALKKLPEDEAIELLTRVRGVGPWTAEMFLMFALGRADVFSAGDLGLVRGMELVYGLPRGAAKERLLAISKRWSPYRTYASLILWEVKDAKPL